MKSQMSEHKVGNQNLTKRQKNQLFCLLKAICCFALFCCGCHFLVTVQFCHLAPFACEAINIIQIQIHMQMQIQIQIHMQMQIQIQIHLFCLWKGNFVAWRFLLVKQLEKINPHVAPPDLTLYNNAKAIMASHNLSHYKYSIYTIVTKQIIISSIIYSWWFFLWKDCISKFSQGLILTSCDKSFKCVIEPKCTWVTLMTMRLKARLLFYKLSSGGENFHCWHHWHHW